MHTFKRTFVCVCMHPTHPHHVPKRPLTFTMRTSSSYHSTNTPINSPESDKTNDGHDWDRHGGPVQVDNLFFLNSTTQCVCRHICLSVSLLVSLSVCLSHIFP